MKLHGLKLENWRGVDDRKIRFENGITIIEGPNEIGKTTLVEALNLLISTLDSSRAANVKAVKPVGNDVGSRVQAEIETGDYHFTYSKQFNKRPETLLEVTKPEPEQHTGREAHNRVTEILDQTMDRPLWEALLVDQGSEVSQAKLRNSQGLAQSLDKAAGTRGIGDEDPDLIEKVEAEYLRYFSPKGQSRIKPQEDHYKNSLELRTRAREALAAVDDDIRQFERSEAEVFRLRDSVPALNAETEELQQQYERTISLARKVESSKEKLEDGQQILEGIANRVADRASLITEIENQVAQLDDLEERLVPMEASLSSLENELQNAKAATEAAKNRTRVLRKNLGLVVLDIEYWQNHEELSRLEKRLQKLKNLAGEKSHIVESLKQSRVDNESLEKLREHENELKVLRGQQSVAATNLLITAQSEIAVEIENEEITMTPGEELEKEVASQTSFNFPGAASLIVTPPAAAEELEEQYNEAQRARDELLNRLNAEDFVSAQAANRARNKFEARLTRIQDNEEQLLDGESSEELGIRQGQLSESCSAWLSNRPDEPALPDDLVTAQSLQRQITNDVELAEEELQSSEQLLESARDQFNGQQETLQSAKLQRDALADSIKDNNTNLAEKRQQLPDEALQQEHTDQQTKVTGLSDHYANLLAELQRSSPEAVETRYENARNALKRAEREQQQASTQLAILKDRLDQAQANGRYEELEAAERALEEADSQFARVSRRAKAVNLLFATLKNHRDTTRRAYVAPLRQRIEELGRIVFGGDFSIDLGEDWTLQSRTLNGQTIPFESLSVGTREQLGILTRLAVAQIVSEQGGVPLIIDDALGFSDPTRLAAMGAAIAHAGQKTQILLLTCTPGRFTHVGNARTVRLPEA